MWSRISAVSACACAALVLAGSASSTTFGVADDAGKYADDGGARFFNMLTDVGMTENRMAVFWDPANPTTIVDQAFLDRSVPEAMRRGIDVIFAIYPLKAVDPGIDVIAFGLSPRGNDDFDAVSNVSHSPIRFLEEVGEAYRKSGRTKPIADDVSIHCYPNQNTDAPSVGYLWPKIGCVNLDRFKQVWWDAFHGTAQPLFREAGQADADGPFVRVFVDEVGYQARIASDKASLYTGTENVPVLDEQTQGSYYAQLIALMACDPTVALLNFFHAVDEPNLPAWQSGLVLPDYTHRASYTAVKQAIEANRQCRGRVVEWRHTNQVVGAHASFRAVPRFFVVGGDEGFSYEVKITRPSSTRRLTGAVGQGEAARDLLFKLPPLSRGAYRVRITLRAETNPARSTSFTKTFRG